MDNKEFQLETRATDAQARETYAEAEMLANIEYANGIDNAVTKVQNGNADALEVYAAIRRAKALLDIAEAKVKEAAYKEATRYDKKERITRLGFEIAISEGRGTKTFVHHPALVEAENRVKVLKNWAFGEVYTDKDTGESYEVQGYWVYSSPIITVKGLPKPPKDE
jgi:hypothetical protein